MRFDSTSSIWPLTGVVLAVAFTGASLWMIFDVRRLRSELEDSVGQITTVMEVQREVQRLPTALEAPGEGGREAAAARFAELERDLRARLADFDRTGPASGRAANVDAGRIDTLAEMHAAYQTVDPSDGHATRAAMNTYLGAAQALEEDTFELIAQHRARTRDISLTLARRWSTALTLLFVSCGIAGAAAILLRIHQVHSLRDRETQLALQETRARLGTVVANAPIAVWSVSTDGIITLSEGAALIELGLNSGQLVGESVLDLYRDHPEIVDAHRRALAGESVNYMSSIGDVHFQSLLIPVRGPDGAVIGATGVATDVSARERALMEKRHAETQRAEMQKAEALARVAGGVAHEFSNLLTVVSGFASLLRTSPELSTHDRDDVSQILKASGRAAELTQQLLAFSRQQRNEPRTLDLHGLVLDARKMLETLLGSHVEVRVDGPEQAVAVHVDPGQFQQVLLNLALNARDAMPEGGTFTLSVTEVRLERAPVETILKPGAYARLGVSDSGTGMDAVTRKRAFEPFFTTKDPRSGTGLGLPTVQGILRQAGGDVAIESEVGRGTTFHLYLPRREAGAIENDGDSRDLDLERGRETVLLVEDEPMVRAFIARVLRSAGYEVLEAGDGPSALELARAYDAPIALLVTDMVMPGMSGRELSQRIRELTPDLPVVFVSAYVQGDPKLEYLQKPFAPEELCRVVRARLDAIGIASGDGAEPKT